MSEDNKDLNVNKEGQALDIDQAKNMTVGEAVRKDSEIKAGVTDEDGVLDKYIKQHREAVASQKFDSKISDSEELDTATLDNFIQKQREELSKNGLVEHEEQSATIASADTGSIVASSLSDEQETVQADTETVEPVASPVASVDNNDRFEEHENDKNNRNKKLLLLLLPLLLVILALFFGLTALNKSNSESKNTKSSTAQTSSSTKDKENSKAKANYQLFNDDYKAFYTDSSLKKLKNSEFDKLTDLESALKALEGTDYYDKAKEKFDSLKKQIDAIKVVNSKFSTEAIKNGVKEKATVKSGVNFDDIKADTLKTGNAELDTLLASVVTDGRKQLSDKAEAEKAAAEKAAEEEAQAQVAQDQANNQAAASTPADSANATQQAPATVNSGALAANTSGLQRNLSRVPYNSAAIADSGNSAWLFNAGVLEKIVATSQARGYISGNNYVLEPVNIVNGNGYYNMFKPDGTYLFTINCKTGYFVGNANGNADGLDY